MARTKNSLIMLLTMKVLLAALMLTATPRIAGPARVAVRHLGGWILDASRDRLGLLFLGLSGLSFTAAWSLTGRPRRGRS